MRYKMTKISNLSSPDSFFFKLKMHQNPYPAVGAYDAPPEPQLGWGGGYPLLIPLPA